MFNGKIKSRILFQTVAIVVICLILILIFGYSKIEDVLLDNHLNLTMSSCEQKFQNAVLNKNLIENTAEQYIHDKNLIKMLKSETYNTGVLAQLNSLTNMSWNIIGAIFVSQNNINYTSEIIYGISTYEELHKNEEFNKLLNTPENSAWHITNSLLWNYRNKPKNTSELIYTNRVYDKDEFVGTLILTVKPELILSMYEHSDADANSFLYTGGLPVFLKNPQTPDDNTVSEIDRLIKNDNSIFCDKNKTIINQKIFNANIITIVSLAKFYNRMSILKTALIVTVILLCVILFFIYRKITNDIFVPLDTLNQKIKSYHT